MSVDEPISEDFLANGIRQHALRWPGGDGAPLIVMLHGCGANSMYWSPLATRLHERFGESVDIAALDHRGCGQSECARDGYTPDVIAHDVLAIADELGHERVSLIGHSRGGWYSAYLAGRFPERVESVVLVDPARMVFVTEQDADDFYGRVRRGLGPFKDLEEAVETMRATDPGARWTDDRIRAVEYGLREQADGTLISRVPGWVLDELRSARVTTDEVGPYLGDIVAPTLLLVASQSDEKRQGEKLAYADGIKDADVQFYDTSHYMHQDRPDEIALSVGEFLATNLRLREKTGS